MDWGYIGAAILVLIVSAVIGIGQQRLLKKFDKNGEAIKQRDEERARQDTEREEKRQKRELLILKGLNANFCVSRELIPCVRGDKEPNGELQEAEEYMNDVKHEIDDFSREAAAK